MRFIYTGEWVDGLTFEVGEGCEQEVAVDRLAQAGLIDAEDHVRAVEREGESTEVGGLGKGCRGTVGGWVGGSLEGREKRGGSDEQVDSSGGGGVLTCCSRLNGGGWVGGWVGGLPV